MTLNRSERFLLLKIFKKKAKKPKMANFLETDICFTQISR